ncbi:protein of unknown function DUF2403, glycine-rich [Phytophthora cactorum]|nr:protein of unknown function DUF2403, glycine-rich [Phytophthora cactorum]
MVKVAMPAKIALATCLYAAVASAETVNFINKCSYPIELYHSQSGSAASKVADIPVGSSHTEDVTGPAHMYRHSSSNSATLVELACDGTLWLDLSVIPPMPGYCGSYEECKNGGKTGFNVPISIQPKENIGKGTCSALYCAADDKDACADAYHFPMDNIKTHSCPAGTELDVTFCYADADQSQQQQNNDQSQQQQQNTDQSQSQHQEQQQTEQSSSAATTTAPTQEERGATQQGTVQSFADLGKVKAKYEYKGKNAGNVPGSYNRVTDLGSCTKEPVQVNSPVGPMSEPVSMIFRGPQEIQNIAVYVDEGGNGSWPACLQVQRPVPRLLGRNDYQGWNGGKKAFVTEVKMPKGKMPDQPAIWMLNAQVMHSNQYGCNCRGIGPVGGCGELDIAEVIETNPSRDKVTTHYYFYDGTVLSPGGDNFAPRSYDSNTVYVTLIDDSNEGLIKIVELESFDFTQTELGSLVQQLVDC